MQTEILNLGVMEYKRRTECCGTSTDVAQKTNRRKFECAFRRFGEAESEEELRECAHQIRFFMKRYAAELIDYVIVSRVAGALFGKIWECQNRDLRPLLFDIFAEIVSYIPKHCETQWLSHEEFAHMFRCVLMCRCRELENVNVLFRILIMVLKRCPKCFDFVNEFDFQEVVSIENETRCKCNSEEYKYLRIFLFYFFKEFMKVNSNQKQILEISLSNFHLSKNEIVVIYILKIFNIFIFINSEFYNDVKLLNFIYHYLLRENSSYFQRHLFGFLPNIFQNEEMNLENVKKIYILFQAILQENERIPEVEEIYRYYQKLNENPQYQEIFYSLGNLSQLFTLLKHECFSKRKLTCHCLLTYFLQIRDSDLFMKIIQEFYTVDFFVDFLEYGEEIYNRLIFRFFVKIIEISSLHKRFFISQSLYQKLAPMQNYEFSKYEEFIVLMRLLEKFQKKFV